MFRGFVLLLAVAWVSPAHAQEQIEITYETALEMARTRAPTLMTAQARVVEAESAVESADVWRFNPQVTGSLGPRFGEDQTTLDGWVSVQQWLELGGQRRARVNAARAGAHASEARLDDTRRRLLSEVTRAFIAELYWQRRVALAEENVAITTEIQRVATRRAEVGDAGGLDQSVAVLAAIRAGTQLDRSRASLRRARGALQVLLGESRTPVCRGDLRALAIPQLDLDIDERADVRALRRDLEAADARSALGRAERVPDIALGGRYARDGADDVVRATVAVSLPLFDRGQGQRALARAERHRTERQLDAVRTSAAIQHTTAQTIARDLEAAVTRFESEGLAPIERTERIATASYRAGAVPLGELLTIRRELVAAKRNHADLLLDAARARVELATITGAFQ